MAASSFLLIVFCVCSSLVSADQNGGFTVDLIHRDASLIPSQRLANAVSRSFASLVDHHPQQAESTVIMSRGDYLMQLSLGTPPFPIKAVLDTGSRLIWTQCKPCIHCYQQVDPLFDPSKSSTYKTISCPSTQCASVNGTCQGTTCHYSITEARTISGEYATETLTLESAATDGDGGPNAPSFQQAVTIGCGFDNTGEGFTREASGVVGFGRGNASLITQLTRSSPSIDGKFSYCLVPLESQTKITSKLNFGSNAVVSGSGVVSVPMSPDRGLPFYFLNLDAIGVNGEKTGFPQSVGGGNIIIDSSTTVTVVPSLFFSFFEPAVAAAIKSSNPNVTEFFPSSPYTLCYNSSEASADEVKVPTLSMHFTGGAVVKLERMHTFIILAKDIECLNLVPSKEFPIYGNLMQMNFLVGYDLKAQTVSFMPSDCTQH